MWVSNKQKTSNNETKWDKSSKLKIEMGPTKLVWVSSAVIKLNKSLEAKRISEK